MSLYVSLGGYEKSVKGATKPKPTLPKEKYMQPILQAAGGSSTQLQDVFWALQGRLEESNSMTVFKALFVLHTMIRSPAATAVLSYLAGDPSTIRLHRVGSVGLNEYTYSKLLKKYARCLEQRIQNFQELGYDVVLAGKRDRFARLRKMSVSKGLLREVGVVQNMMKPLMDCAFFEYEYHDEVVVAAFQMILKDMLSFYSAINEGIINLLEHYFEMSQKDASRALEIYRRFCFQTENFVAFLDAAKRQSSQLRNSIPTLKHAPLSLAKALEEYLHETDFSQHETARQEGKTTTDKAPEEPKEEKKQSQPEEISSSKQALQDFFEALEQPQSTPFHSAYSGFTNFQTQPDWFGLPSMSTGATMGMIPQMTGNPFSGLQHGFMQPHVTGMNPFTPQMQMTPYLTGQPTPVRTPQQQPLMPQHTMNTTPFDSIFGQLSLQPTGAVTQAPSMPMQPPSWPSAPPRKEPSKMPASQTEPPVETNGPPKPSAVSGHQQNLRPQKTGTINPFSIPSDFEEPEPIQKAPPKPTLNELARNAWSNPSTASQGTSNMSSTMVPQKTGLLGSVASEFVRPQTGSVPNQDGGSSEPSTSLGSQAFGTQHGPEHVPSTAPLTQNQSFTLTGDSQPFPRPHIPTSPESLPLSAQATGIGLGISGSNSPAMHGMHQNALHAHTTGLHSLSRFNGTSLDAGYAPLTTQATGTRAFAGTPPSRLNALGGPQSPGFGAISGPNGLSSNASINVGQSARLHDIPGNARPSAGNVVLSQNDPVRWGTTPGLDHQSQITSLTGIKPFQPSSEFGASLLRGTSHVPSQPPPSAPAEAPASDLLQL